MTSLNPHILFKYKPESVEELTFIYLPYTGYEQIARRDEFFGYTSTYTFMKQVFQDRMVLFGIERGEEGNWYMWPEDPVAEDSLLSNIPKNIIIEVGAVILGWRRGERESQESFNQRILDDITNPKK